MGHAWKASEMDAFFKRLSFRNGKKGKPTGSTPRRISPTKNHQFFKKKLEALHLVLGPWRYRCYVARRSWFRLLLPGTRDLDLKFEKCMKTVGNPAVNSNEFGSFRSCKTLHHLTPGQLPWPHRKHLSYTAGPLSHGVVPLRIPPTWQRALRHEPPKDLLRWDNGRAQAKHGGAPEVSREFTTNFGADAKQQSIPPLT